MKIVAFSDLHADATTAGLDRFEDVERLVWGNVFETTVRESADMLLFLGDLCDPDSRRAHRSIALLHELAFSCLQRGIAFRALVGNHDVVEDGSGTSTLSALATARGIKIRRTVDVDRMVDIRVYENPIVERFGGVLIAALPYPSRARMYDPKEFAESVEPPLDTPIVFIGHLSIAGIHPGSESGEMARGREVFWPIETIRRRFGAQPVCLAGHYHKAQTFDTIDVVGSLERLRFDEEDHVPGFVVLDV